MTTYVSQDKAGALRVGQAGVSLDSVVFAFEEGLAPESIQQQYPALSLEEVYGAIAYYLGHREQVQDYLAQQRQRWADLREQVDRTPSPVAKRLKALRDAAKTTS